MLYPNRIIRQRSRLLPPAIFLDQVYATIAIHVPGAQPVRKPLVVSFRGDRMKGPACAWIFPIGLGVTNMSVGTTDDFRLAIAGHIGKAGGFIIQSIEDHVAL